MNAPGASTSDPTHNKPKRVNINTSLSTINPIHHEAMNNPTLPLQPGMRGARALEMRDVILWQQEQAQYQGELGFTMNFPDPSDIFRQFTMSAASEQELPIGDHATLVAASQDNHKAIIQLQQRKIIMDQHGPLLASTERDIEQKLMSAGVPEHEFSNKSLRQKIVLLVEIQEPPPKENFVSVLINVASTTKGRSHILEVNLPLSASMAEVYALLEEVVKALLSEKGLSYERGGAWKYHLIDQSRSRLLMNKSSPLETDIDYNRMLEQVSKVGNEKPPVAVLTQDGVAKPMAMSESNPEALGGSKARVSDTTGVLDDDDDVPEVLDEDGQPFFEPLDLDRMAEKYASYGDDLTEENDVQGFWR